MKRRVLRISVAIFVVVGILLGLLMALTWDWGPEMSFGFLNGRTLTARIEPKPGRPAYRTTHEIYSFEADFNDVCAEADAELSAMGFAINPPGSRGISMQRDYALGSVTSRRIVVIGIRNRRKLEVYSAPKSSGHASQHRSEWLHTDGWVTVDITRGRRRAWPPRHLLNRLHMLLRRAASKPPSKKS